MNESTIVQLASWGVSFDNNWYERCLKMILGMQQSDLTSEKLDSIWFAHQFVHFFYVLNPFSNWEKVFKSHSCMRWPSSSKDLQNLAFACNKTWDDGRREMIGLSSPNTYEKKQAITHKTNPKKNKQSKNPFYTCERAMSI